AWRPMSLEVLCLRASLLRRKESRAAGRDSARARFPFPLPSLVRGQSPASRGHRRYNAVRIFGCDRGRFVLVRRARVSSPRCVSRVRLLIDGRLLRQAFETLLRNSLELSPVLVSPALAWAFFPVLSAA